jgi:tetratricopeptide (TPR) repeat protein
MPALLLVLATVGAAVCGEEPPYKRLLQGDDAKKAAALEKRINELWAAGKLAEAVVTAQEAAELRRRAQGADHWAAAEAACRVETLRRLAELTAEKRAALADASGLARRAAELFSRGKYAEAEPLLRKVVAAYEAALGPDHPETARTYYLLASNLNAQGGRYREAELLDRKALALIEAALGPGHPRTALGYNNLANNLDAQGRSREAEPLARKALAIEEAALGPAHRRTAAGYHNLAHNLDAQGRYTEAEPLFRKALAAWEKALGPGHPDTAGGYSSLAVNLDAQGRPREAEPLHRRALAAREKALGPEHPDTALGYNNLAYHLRAQGRHREAELLDRKALALTEAALGPGHPHTALSYNNLALNLQAQGRYTEAEPLFRRALAAREKALGPDHPQTAEGYHNLARVLQTQGRAREAEPLFRKALALTEVARGPGHPDTATGYNNLANNLEAQSRYKEAEPLFRKALALTEAARGPGHPYTALSYANLAADLQAQGRPKEAEPLWRTAAAAVEAARPRLAASGLDRAAAVGQHPHLGLAVCRARLGRPADAWEAAEAGLARGLLDDLAARAALPPDPRRERRAAARAARLAELDRLLPPLVAAEKPGADDRRRRDELLGERAALDAEADRESAELSGQAVWPLERVQAGLAADEALVFWLDVLYGPAAADPADRWGCVLRRAGGPAWARLPGSGPDESWTDDDVALPRRLRGALARGGPDADEVARRLASQRLGPLEPHLAARDGLPPARRLVVVPFGSMAGVPVEALTDGYLVSYAPSGTVLARLRQKHRPLTDPTLLALGDPDFALPAEAPPPEPPEHGLYLSLVLPGGNAARAGLRAGDVLLRYGDTRLSSNADLKPAESGERIPVAYWRDGKEQGARLPPGKLGVVVSDDPPPAADRKAREQRLLADARTRYEVKPLPGTRLEARALAALLPGKVEVLLGSEASEQRLGELAASGRLRDYRLVHLATHGTIDPAQAGWSALLLARDTLPGPEEQAKLAAAGKKVPTGRLTVETIAHDWNMDADLVTLSACETALGPDGGGEGLLGFSQVLLARGARSLVLSLWKVDDTATALLMTRFYENLLGRRAGLKAPLPKAEALREAKRWLRALPRAEAESLAARLGRGELRASEVEARPVAKVEGRATGEAPYAHPRYWAAFILLGDPD